MPLINDGVEGEVIVDASVVSTNDTSDMDLLLTCDVGACEVDGDDESAVVDVVSVVVEVEVI